MDLITTVTWDAQGHARIDGELTIYQVEQVQRQLLRLVEECRRIDLDLGGVCDLDSAGFQLLLALLAECETRRLPIELHNVGAVVSELCDLYGSPLPSGPSVTPGEMRHVV